MFRNTKFKNPCRFNLFKTSFNSIRNFKTSTKQNTNKEEKRSIFEKFYDHRYKMLLLTPASFYYDKISEYVKQQQLKKRFKCLPAQCQAVAEWYAQFLPGIRSVSFSEQYQNVKPDQTKNGSGGLMLGHIISQSASNDFKVTPEQYEKFVKILSAKILKENVNAFGNPYISIGHPSSYGPPKIVLEAVKEANIQGEISVPYKSHVEIQSNGLISINGTQYTIASLNDKNNWQPAFKLVNN